MPIFSNPRAEKCPARDDDLFALRQRVSSPACQLRRPDDVEAVAQRGAERTNVARSALKRSVTS